MRTARDAARREPMDEQTLNCSRDVSCYERVRDLALKVFESKLLTGIGLANLVLIIVDGALFFFLLMGWHAMCDKPSRTACDPRNWWYNFSIQVLNVCFTYGALVSLPWRLANFYHLFAQRRRSNQDFLDFYGDRTENIWFHIPSRHRKAITLVLLCNNFSQFSNQGTRIVYYSYALQNVSPGNIWTNVFFALAFSFAGIGAAYQARQETLVRRRSPGRFPDPLQDALQVLKSILHMREGSKTSSCNSSATGPKLPDQAVEIELSKSSPVPSAALPVDKEITECSPLQVAELIGCDRFSGMERMHDDTQKMPADLESATELDARKVSGIDDLSGN